MRWQTRLCRWIGSSLGNRRQFGNCEISWGYLLESDGVGIALRWGRRVAPKEGERRWLHGIGIAIPQEELEDNCFPFWLQPVYYDKTIYDHWRGDYPARAWTGEIRRLRWSRLMRWRY